MASANQIRVLLVDDDVRVRQTLTSILKPYSNIEVVGEASDGDEAVTSVGNLRPTVVVMDISMKKMDGITAIREIIREFPDANICMVTAFDDEDIRAEAFRAGALRFVLKDNLFELEAILLSELEH
jgi:DNA-binding NarL/FixJ family response regulator